MLRSAQVAKNHESFAAAAACCLPHSTQQQTQLGSVSSAASLKPAHSVKDEMRGQTSTRLPSSAEASSLLVSSLALSLMSLLKASMLAAQRSAGQKRQQTGKGRRQQSRSAGQGGKPWPHKPNTDSDRKKCVQSAVQVQVVASSTPSTALQPHLHRTQAAAALSVRC